MERPRLTLRTQAIHGLKWQAIEVVGRQLLGLVVFTTLARLLDPAAFGLVGMVGVYLAFVGMFVDQGIGTALIQRKDLEPDHVHTAFWFNLGFAALMCGLTIAVAGPVASFFAEPQLEPLLRWASLGLVIGAMGNIQATVFIREMDFKRPAMRALLAQLAGGVVGVTMAVLDYGVWALIGQQLVAAMAGTIFLWIASSYRPRVVFSIIRLRDLAGTSGPVFATSLLWFVSSRADQFFIGRFLGTNALGYYVVGSKLPEVMRTAALQPVAAVSLPALSRMQGDNARLASAVYRGMSVVSVTLIPVFIGLAAIAPTLVPLLFGAEWAPSVVPLQLLSIYFLANALQVFFHPLLIATGGAGSYLTLNVLHAAGTITACVIGARISVGAVLIGLIINTSFVAVLAFGYMCRRVGLETWPYWRSTVPCVFASALMFGVVTAVAQKLTGYAGLITQVALGAVSYATVLLLVGRPVVDEVRVALKRRSTDTPLPTNLGGATP